MKLPPKGTSSRAILDFIGQAQTRTLSAICAEINNINKKTVQRLLDAEFDRGALRFNETIGYGLTAATRKAMREEQEAMVTPVTREFKPLSKAHIPSVEGLRDGSNQMRQFKSKF